MVLLEYLPLDLIESVMQVLDGLISEYETSCHGPGKWQKLAMFLQQRFAPAFSSSFLFVICFMFSEL